MRNSKVLGVIHYPRSGTFCDKLSHWGMDNNKQAVIYDDAGGAFAGRMWWMLKWLELKMSQFWMEV